MKEKPKEIKVQKVKNVQNIFCQGIISKER
jgi:hypothetical protein